MRNLRTLQNSLEMLTKTKNSSSFGLVFPTVTAFQAISENVTWELN